MTYRELAECISLMPPPLKDSDVSILEHQDEIFGVSLLCPAWAVKKDDVLDGDNPLLVLNGVLTEQELAEVDTMKDDPRM